MSVFILQNVSKSFIVNKKNHVVLNDISLSFPDKGLVSIVGKSGSGKSTLLNIMMGIEKPTSGKVLFKGRNVSKFNDRKFSGFHLYGVSTVFQHYNLFDDLTSYENVALPLMMRGERDIKSKVEKMFDKFNLSTLISRKTKNLSGGEKQRVAIIRSLITEPDVILCDEPTGALDERNSREILAILKRISSERLVIMVSHNKALVDKFSDYIIEIKDGKIVNDSTPLLNRFNEKKDIKTRYRNRWIRLFLSKNFKKNAGKNFFSFISCSIGFAAVFVCVGFLVGSKSSYEESMTKNLSIGTAKVSEIESVVISDSPLTYQKTVRPKIEDIDNEFKEFKTIRVEENLSYFISSNVSCTFLGDTFNGFSMEPVYDLSLKKYGSDLLVNGRSGDNSFDSVLVNEEFVKLIGKDILNKSIIIKNVAQTNYKTFDENEPFIKDEFILEKPVKIVGIIREFPFLNTPKIYYSYEGAKTFLKSQPMENLSYYLGYGYSYYDYLSTCKPDDIASSYSSYIFLDGLTEKEQFFKKIKKLKNKSLEITSNVLTIKDTYITFISSFSKTLFVFSIIVFLGINFILGMISLSSFLQERKNTAIMTCLGSRNGSIYRLYLCENYIVVSLAFVFSIFIAIMAEQLLNPFLSTKFALTKLITIPFLSFHGFKFGLIILFLLIIAITSSVFTITPMLFYRHGFLTDELRDE